MVKDLQLHSAIRITLYFVAALWLLKIAAHFLPGQSGEWGVLPRSEIGLRGILFAPLIHGSSPHLLANTPPLMILGTALLYGYPRARWWALGIIWLVSGIGVWLFGRNSFHIGASGVVHGMFFFLFTIGILRRDKRSIALLMIAFFLYGGMLLTIFPYDPEVSFEYHFFGAIGGIIGAFLLRKMDKLPVRPAYSWETAELDDEDPVIDDEPKITP